MEGLGWVQLAVNANPALNQNQRILLPMREVIRVMFLLDALNCMQWVYRVCCAESFFEFHPFRSRPRLAKPLSSFSMPFSILLYLTTLHPSQHPPP